MVQVDTENLWKAFKKRLYRDWSEKYHDYGMPDRINQRTNLAKAIEADMYLVLGISRREKGIIPSWNTINTYLRQDGLGQPKWKTLDVLSEYLGFEHYDAFQENYVADQVELPLSSSATWRAVAVGDITQFSYSLKRISIGIIALCVLGYFVYTYVNYYNIVNRHSDRKEISVNLQKANQLEYNLYAAVPNRADTLLLQKYFTTTGEARANIMEVVNRSVSENRLLDQEDSFRQLDPVDIQFIYLWPNRAKVKTIEYWKLNWLKAGTKTRDASYNEINIQTYYLKRINDKWLIDRNEFTGTADLHPETQ